MAQKKQALSASAFSSAMLRVSSSSPPDPLRWAPAGTPLRRRPIFASSYLVAGLEEGGGAAAKNSLVDCFSARGKVPQHDIVRRFYRKSRKSTCFAASLEKCQKDVTIWKKIYVDFFRELINHSGSLSQYVNSLYAGEDYSEDDLNHIFGILKDAGLISCYYADNRA